MALSVTMSDDATDLPLTQRAGERRKVFPASCELEQGPEEPTTLIVSTRGGMIKLDPQITGACVITLDEGSACVLRDRLTDWFG
ncbi:MAG: hypothetical protein WBF75_14405 [Pseudonocardiaceae bacterium]